MARSSKLESGFQDRLIKEIEGLFPECMIFKMDYPQGIPDLLILKDDKWASLENKKTKDAEHRPNQDFYVEKMNNMSFSSFIYPENKVEVLEKLKRHFRD